MTHPNWGGARTPGPGKKIGPKPQGIVRLTIGIEAVNALSAMIPDGSEEAPGHLVARLIIEEQQRRQRAAATAREGKE